MRQIYFYINLLASILFFGHFLYAQNLQRDWSSYYAGEATELNNIIYDSFSNSIFIAGTTADSVGVATIGAHKESMGSQPVPIIPYSVESWSNTDFFLAKFTVDGEQLWGTYIGGDDQEQYTDIACDPFGNIYLIGFTRSTTDIATPGAHKSAKSSDSSTLCLLKYDNNGNKI